MHKITIKSGKDIKRQTRQEYIQWTITIFRYRNLFANNKKNNVDDK